MFAVQGCLNHTYWIGLLIAILVFFGLKGCHSTEFLPCFVQADSDVRVAVRVGPGTDRAIRFYLSDDQVFEVIGQAAADDGSGWWQIDVEDVPQAWVAQTDVVAVGNCSGIQDEDAPPIIENRNVEPPAASPTSTPTPINQAPAPPSGGNGQPPPTATQGLITNTPPMPTDLPTLTPMPSSTGTSSN